MSARPAAAFRFARVESPADVPREDERCVDVAVLDMNHGWPNLGHDSLVTAVREATEEIGPALDAAGLSVRALSYDVRRSQAVPAAPNGRFALYLGTGGPGHLDPRQNDGSSPGSQGIREDASWEGRVFALFDAIHRSPRAALLGVCHTFGVMCRWAGVAEPVLRPAAKGGKSAGVLENILTPEGEAHPWFARMAEELPDHRRLRVIDHRLFDLIPTEDRPAGFTPIGYETQGLGGPRGDALTMAEFARDAGRVMPRVFGVNHHPEILDRTRQMRILQEKLQRGEVTREWAEDRGRILMTSYPDERTDRRLRITSDYTLFAPLRFHLYRQLRLRAEALGLEVDVHEDRVPEQAAAGSAAEG
ncbi:MAG TPA: hypothetical protein VGQ78_03280 [Vicinamibacteria bacterium]|jgi:hypothetical protein|nr:hypothetical protein [Vicinamibacteria bacterium]